MEHLKSLWNDNFESSRNSTMVAMSYMCHNGQFAKTDFYDNSVTIYEQANHTIQVDKWKSLIEQYKSKFKEPHDVNKLFTHKIPLKDNKVIYIRPYRRAPLEKEFIELKT